MSAWHDTWNVRPPNTIMILEIKAEITTNLSNCQCDKCGTIGNFKNHSCYERFLIQISKTEKIKIQRVKCVSCGTTHALIPKDVIPYKQYSLSLVVLLFLIWADPPKKKNYKNIEVPNTSKRRLIFECKKESALLLALTIDRSVIQKNTNFFESPTFIVVCWEKLNKKFSENIRLNNLKNQVRTFSRGFT